MSSKRPGRFALTRVSRRIGVPGSGGSSNLTLSALKMARDMAQGGGGAGATSPAARTDAPRSGSERGL